MSLLTLSITLLTMLTSTQIQTAAELPLPVIDIAACKNLYQAARIGDIEGAQQALDQGADINVGALYGDMRPHHNRLPTWTPLAIAAKNGHLNTISFLLKRGALIDAVIKGNTPLIIICSEKTCLGRHKSNSNRILTHKANVNEDSAYFGKTPLMCTIEYYKITISLNC